MTIDRSAVALAALLADCRPLIGSDDLTEHIPGHIRDPRSARWTLICKFRLGGNRNVARCESTRRAHHGPAEPWSANGRTPTDCPPVPAPARLLTARSNAKGVAPSIATVLPLAAKARKVPSGSSMMLTGASGSCREGPRTTTGCSNCTETHPAHISSAASSGHPRNHAQQRRNTHSKQLCSFR